MTDYELKDFGADRLFLKYEGAGEEIAVNKRHVSGVVPDRKRTGYEKVDTTTILSILIAFTIQLFVEAFKSYADLTIAASYFFGALVLIFFMLYTVDYYEKIWIRWFALPNDFAFFRVYSLVSGVIVNALMNVEPEFWYWYITALFVLLSWKKRATKNQFKAAFNARFGSVNKCTDDQGKAIYYLAENMSWNFFVYGVLMAIPVSLALNAAYLWGTATFAFANNGKSISGNVVYVGICATYGLALILFWYKKIRGGLNYMVEQVEAGNSQFFAVENR